MLFRSYRDVLRDFKESAKLIDAMPAVTAADIKVKNNKKAIIDIMTAYTYSVLVDTFGDVPYSEALNIEVNPLPKYDDAKTIYKDLISRLKDDNNLLSAGSDSFGSADLIYGGNAGKWKLFANSLRLRLAINIDDADHAIGNTEVLAAVADGIISNNSDNTALIYLMQQPNTNPLYLDLVISGRNDFLPANTIVNKMNTLNDPRREKYFDLTGATTVYSGGVYGSSNGFANFSHISATLADPTYPATLMSYSEVEFLLAEAVERSIAVGGTASNHYNNAITASMESWGVATADIVTFLAEPAVNYTTATGNWKQKIGEQSWLAQYNRGYEGWTNFRRLDFPALIAPAVTFNSITKVPTRFTYPANEQTLNGTNVSGASAAIGGNTLLTKLFWDKF